MAEKTNYLTIDEYIASFPQDKQEIMQKMRKVIREEAPKAEEKMSWQMPTFALHGNLVHFAAAGHHLGFYPGASGVEAFLPKLAGYKTSKGAIQFPYAQPIPYELVREIVRFRVAENTRDAASKGTPK